MNSLLAVLGLLAIVLVIAAARDSHKLRGALQKHSSKLSMLPQAISMLLVTAQLPELVRMVGQISPVNIAAALLLLAITAAVKSGTENEKRL